ncbi:hypothetical protein B9Y60_10530 [Stenotrophomonas maltophilia]|uniref:ArdC family protein n=1 Tax=Stenotrophomonas maltophilia TaxID=40324 RepID=UPI000C25F662|nr:zincin-like metallopeptidase domain-containing protein [Stenotrophomonas maltophilia]PJL52192.1 hypothetical protein B9Y73_10530 [Stenotrophomonas maltophilia]PJL55113.1 hypothetical protein B9Y60_10530 [Stenotrophomonas maltophilia]
MTTRENYIQEVANGIIQELEKGTAPWQMPWQGDGVNNQFPVNSVTGNAYRGANLMHLLVQQIKQKYESNVWMTYKQATEAGAQVRRGEKSTVICFADFSKFNAQQEAIKNGEWIDEKALLKGPLMIYSNVFNASQIDGLKNTFVPPVPLQESERLEIAEKLLKDSGAVIHHGGNRAFYRGGSSDEIHLPDWERFKSKEHYYATALHELGHWTGHPTRLNRKMGNGFGTEDYAKEELRAEISSMLMSQRLGIVHDSSQHHSYIKSWLQILKDDPKEIFRACNDAEKICEFIGLKNSLIYKPTKEQEERNERMEQKAEEKAQERAQKPARKPFKPKTITVKDSIIVKEPKPPRAPNAPFVMNKNEPKKKRTMVM